MSAIHRPEDLALGDAPGGREGDGPAGRAIVEVPPPPADPGPAPAAIATAGPSAQLDCLDALRGIAVLLVIFFHLGSVDMAVFPAVGAALSPFRYGYTGVHLFLVLSGFCLTHSMIHRARAGKAPGYRAYMAARWRRIAPPYYAAMALYLAIPLAALLTGRTAATTGRFLTWRQVTVHGLFLHGLWGDTIYAINTPFWSLSLEFQFYLILPLLLAVAARFGSAAMVAGVLAATVAFRLLLAFLAPGLGHLLNGFFLGRLTEFALGMGAAWLYNRRAPGRGPWPVAAPLAGAVACFVAGALVRDGRAAIASDYAFGLGYTLLLVAVLGGVERSPRFRRGFESPALVWVGVISYSLYLCHSLVIERCVQVYLRVAKGAGPAADLAAFAAIFGLVLLVGWAFHVSVERRFLAKKPGRARA